MQKIKIKMLHNNKNKNTCKLLLINCIYNLQNLLHISLVIIMTNFLIKTKLFSLLLLLFGKGHM